MFVVIGAIMIIAGMVMVWFNIPYSQTRTAFEKDTERLIASNRLHTEGEAFSEDDFAHLPAPLQKYLKNCGYIGTPQMSYMKIEFRDVDFAQGQNGPNLTIDYTQYNFVREPSRMAFIDSSLFGIPFEGYDYYENGTGGMRGVIAKAITLFDQTGADMDKACLATFLAESIFAPSILTQDYISFEEISDYEVKATISFGGQTASGNFTFNEQYEMTAFVTNDRAISNPDGTMEYIPWSALCSDYKLSEYGIMQPTKMQAVWNYDEGDFLYFDGEISRLSYGYAECA